MCGIVGILARARSTRVPEDEIRRMTSCLVHRGPDGSGHWQDPQGHVALGHRRLSIQDLSERGAQPFTSADGRIVLSYNGELYNIAELRAELQSLGVRLRGTSDTELVAESIAHWGISDALRRFAGMFAFLAWNNTDCSLVLARDRIGIKPLYWAKSGEYAIAASELRAILRFPGFNAEIDAQARRDFFAYGFVTGDRSIFRNVKKVLPGTFLVWRAAESGPVEHCYWRLDNSHQPRESSQGDTAAEIEDILRTSVRQHLVSDVPVGIFLSGGIDSSLVAAIAQSVADRPVQTFTVAFEDSDFDESGSAKQIATHLGTNHEEISIGNREVVDLVPGLARIYDEPFADSSQIPTVALCRKARDFVTVALSGDGGDEFFVGYERYKWVRDFTRLAAILPGGLRSSLFRGATSVLGTKPKAQRLLRGLEILASDDWREMYEKLLTLNGEPNILKFGSPPATRLARDFGQGDSIVKCMQASDIASYLPDDILTKVDRASMSTSLEVRVPLLDHRLIEKAISIPSSANLQSSGKKVLRTILARYVPQELFERPKSGFDVPLADWLRGPLRPWAHELLKPTSLPDDLVDPTRVEKIWRRHQAGDEDHHKALWPLLMYRAWEQQWL